MFTFLFLIFSNYLFKQVASKSFCEAKYEAAPIQKSGIQILTSDKPYTEFVHKKRYNDRIAKGTKSILYINGTKSGQEFIACAATKAGSTRLRLLLYRIMNENFRGGFIEGVWKEDGWVGVYEFGPQKLEELLMEKHIPRYLFVRDPYTRAVSMYNDKVIAGKKLQQNFLDSVGLKGKFRGQNLSFEQFIEMLYHRPIQKSSEINQRIPLNLHYVSQSDLCGLSYGMKYNYIFKQEDINSWFDCFVQQINFADEVMHGWPEEDQCYFSSPKNPCNGPSYENSTVNAKNEQFKRHNTGSSQISDAFYNNQTIIDMVSELFLQDFVNFNYALM